MPLAGTRIIAFQVIRQDLRSISSRYQWVRCHSIAAATSRSSKFSDRDRDRDRDDLQNIAVLGGGISGLVSAYCLAKQLPSTCKITLFEGSDRLGGWLNTRSVDIGTGSVLFERGPRTLRPNAPNGHVTLALLRDLGLQKHILTTGKDSPAAQNRYVYYPDHLVRMPGPGTKFIQSIRQIQKEPLFNGLFSALLQEPFVSRRSESLLDESIGSFVSRRFSNGIADNIVAALIHGIYAGDIYQLSIRSVFPYLWYLEGDQGSILRGAIKGWSSGKQFARDSDRFLQRSDRDIFLGDASDVSLAAARTCSVYSLKGGLGVLAEGLRCALQRTNVQVQMSTKICKIGALHGNSPKTISVETLDERRPGMPLKKQEFSQIISTLPSAKLASCLTVPSIVSCLEQTPSVTVMVVNLFYNNPNLLKIKGFGYLLPRSLPERMNPEKALGVIFDSDATVGQDDVVGTKVTVMLGGHWWSEAEHIPDAEEASHMAKAVLRRHLKIVDEPVVMHASCQKDCIPQYTVGHDDRMARLSNSLMATYQGRLRLTGNSYIGVGLNDCVRGARDLVSNLISGPCGTGLEEFEKGRRWSWYAPIPR